MNSSAMPQDNANPDHVERAREELRAHATTLMQAWDRLNSSRWNAAHGRGLQLAAKQLVRACERLRLSLSRKAGELETFVRVFVDTSLVPNSEQLRTLSALVSTLASTVLALDMVSGSSTAGNAGPDLAAAAASPIAAEPAATLIRSEPSAASPEPRAKRPVDDDLIVLIGNADEFGVELAPAFAEHGYSVKSFTRADAALALMTTMIPRAVVLAPAASNAIPSLRQVLVARPALKEAHREPALAVVTPRQDLGRRLVAMRQGIKYFEPPVDPLAMLVALTSEAVAVGSSTKVLLVDGDRDRGHQSADWLKDAGYTVRYCQNSSDALEAIEGFKPQVAVIDADMRGAESMRLLHGLRDNPLSADIPVVLAASSRELALREQAIAGGADEYLLKPLKPRHLVSVIESRIKRSKRFAPKRTIARDESTGLYSRREFIDRADAACGQKNAVVLFIVLDEHESLRKQLGISGQTRLDVVVGQALKENLRSEDMPALYQDCRYLVLLRRNDRASALASAESLRESLARRRIQIGDREVKLEASLGLANLDGDSADVGVHNAEAAGLAAMHLGGNRSMWYETSSASLIPAERDSQLRGLLQTRRFGQYMEIRGAPLLPLRGRVPGQYELVLSWRPGGNAQAAASHADLLRLARDAGCVKEFDRFVVGEALSVRADLLKRGRQVRLVVDLSPWSLDDGGFADALEQVLRERRLSGTGVALTLPAAVLGDRVDSLVALAQRMKPQAIRIGLRDVGRDMTLVPRLRGVPVDYLRLAPELSAGVSSGDRSTELLSALIRRAHQGGMMVIGCSVDNREQAQHLKLVGVDYVESPSLGAPGTQFDFDFARWMTDLQKTSA